MKIQTLQQFLISVGLTPDEAVGITRRDFRRGLRIYHEARRYDTARQLEAVFSTSDGARKTEIL